MTSAARECCDAKHEVKLKKLVEVVIIVVDACGLCFYPLLDGIVTASGVDVVSTSRPCLLLAHCSQLMINQHAVVFCKALDCLQDLACVYYVYFSLEDVS